MLPAGEVRPLPQLVHDVEPAIEYVPDAHKPEQVAFVKPLVAPNVPAGQLVHDDEPIVEYVPAAQATH